MKRIFAKHRFLWQMLLTIAFLICVPMLLINWFAIRSSIRAVEQERMDTYRRYSQNFMLFFDSELKEMVSCSVDISVNKAIDPGTDELYLWDAFKEMRQYKNRVYSSSDTFLFSRDSDYILGTTNSYAVSRFADHFAKSTDVPGFKETFSDFLEGYSGGTQFLPIDNPKNSTLAGMLVFFPVSVRSRADSVLIFHISPSSLNDAFFSQTDADNIFLYIFDSQGRMLISGNTKENPAVASEEFAGFLSDPEANLIHIKAGQDLWHAFRTRSVNRDLSFVVVVPDSEINNASGGIANSLNFMIWITGALIVIMLALVVYINYSPIRKLRDKYIGDEPQDLNDNEIESISHLLDTTITENKTLTELVDNRTSELSNHVLHSMLSGREVSDEERLLISLSNTFDRVFVVSVYDTETDSELYNEICRTLMSEFRCRILISNDLYEKCLLFVCAVAAEDGDLRLEIGNRLCGLLREGLSDSRFKVGIGALEELETGMYNASLTSLIALDQGEYGRSLVYEKAIRDFSHVEYYPNEQVLAFIRYLKDGSRRQAAEAFDAVLEQMRSRMISQLIERYICQDIINTVIKSLDSIDIALPEENVLGLMHFRNLNDLTNLMRGVIELVCDEVETRRLNVEKNLLSEMVEYIESNVTNPDLGREMLASRFGISVNTVSSLINGMLGCSFREYITTRRIEISQQLLRGTDLSVSDVCRRSGFRDTSYFIRTFKNITGVTPNVYRNTRQV